VPELTRGRPRSIDILGERPRSAEVLVGPQTLTITLAVPELDRGDADVILTRHSLRIRHRADPTRLSLVVPLPVAVEPERYILRHSHGVFDVVVERASR
jgi:HSP20 family molecular chaperone IbpA